MANSIRNEKIITVSSVLVEIDCDTPEDLPTPETQWRMGSIAHVISTGVSYKLNSSGQWIVQNQDSAAIASGIASIESQIGDINTILEGVL